MIFSEYSLVKGVLGSLGRLDLCTGTNIIRHGV